MPRKRLLLTCAILAGCIASATASADTKWPNKIVGTWKGTSNQSPIVLTISTETTGAYLCHNLTGTIEDVKGNFTGNMIGFYCPASGNVEFMRYPTGSNVAFQVYNGSLSQGPVPADVGGLLMGGSFGQYSQTFGPLGQYSFSLKR